MQRACIYSPRVGTALLLDNDRCRAWDFSYPPDGPAGGAVDEVHQHTLDYVFCTPCGGPEAVAGSVRLLGYNPDGSLQFDSVSHDGEVRPRSRSFLARQLATVAVVFISSLARPRRPQQKWHCTALRGAPNDRLGDGARGDRCTGRQSPTAASGPPAPAPAPTRCGRWTRPSGTGVATATRTGPSSSTSSS
jgi:hypothetical protein